MELLQTVQYAYVNRCDDPRNKFLTEVAYILVIVQPLMWNILFLLRTTECAHRRVFELAIALLVAWMAVNVYSRLAYDPTRDAATNVCGFFNHTESCTYRDTDKSHLYWQWTARHLGDMSANYLMYMLLWFVPALLVKQHHSSIFTLMISCAVGLFLAAKFGSTIKEFPATWCYISIPFVVLGFIQGVYEMIAKGR